MTGNPEERINDIADLIGALSPVPAGWIEAAQQLPMARHDFDPSPTLGRLRARRLSGLGATEADGDVSRAR